MLEGGRAPPPRQAFQEQVAAVRSEDLIFVDESGVNRAMTRTHARSPRGSRAYGSAPRNWGVTT